MKKSLLITLGVVGLILLWGIGTYNGLIGSSQGVSSSWAQVESQYQRRYDLVPNLVEAVKGAMVQEQTIFGDIAKARTQYAGAKSIDDKVAASGELDSAISRLLVIMENYPQLKSNENVTNLMTQLEGTENRIAVERMRFNEAVGSYNLKVKQFPSSIVASITGFKESKFFESQEGAEVAPKVDLTTKPQEK